MRLVDNKGIILGDKVYDSIYIKEYNLRESDWTILHAKQKIWVKEKVIVTVLIRGIYDEING